MKKLKHRWGITSTKQLILIFIVFAITGSTAAKIAEPITAFIGIPRSNAFLYWFVRVFLIFPFYQVLLLIFGFIFGQFQFFWKFEKKMLSRMGLRFLFKDE